MVQSEPAWEVVSPGIQSLIQDLGRVGFASVGVAASGAYDTRALAFANESLGNPASAPGIECLLGGLVLRALRPTRLALFLPATASIEQVDLRPGETVAVPRIKRGLRAYLALCGGIHTTSILGSSSTDTMSGLGPAPLAAGDVLTVAAANPTGITVSRPTDPAIGSIGFGHDPNRPIDVILNADAVAADSVSERTLRTEMWSVSPVSSRVGMRLNGPDLALNFGAGDRSQPVMPGTIQAPTGRELIILGPDGPTTGGYPVVGVVADRDLSRLAQFRPGEPMSFTVRHNTAVSP